MRNGKPIHYATIWRWVNTGIRGIRLKASSVGIMACTTEADLAEFFQAVQAARQARRCGQPAPDCSSRASERRKASEEAERELARRGA